MAPKRSTAALALAERALERFPDESAELLERTDAARVAELLERQSVLRTVGVMQRMTPDRAARILAALPADTARKVLTSLDPQRAAGLLARLDESERDACLATLDPARAEELRSLAAYPPNTAGALMDPRITTFRADATVRDVVRRLRSFRHRRVQDVFVIDGDTRLLGSVAMQEVVLAPLGATLGTLMRSPTPSVRATSPGDDVVCELQQYGVSSLPVVDFDGRVLGVLRHDELVAAARDAASAEAVTMVGASPEERALSSPWFAVRKRLPWLLINLGTAFLAASVVGLFEDTIARYTALAILLPVVAGQSGNAGAQALAVTMRGLALREVRVTQWLRVALKEVAAGAGNGVAVALTTSVAVYLWSGSIGLASVIGIAMVLSMTVAGLAGAVVPMLLTALRQDPAQSSSIVLTTVTDVVGFMSFLGVATLLSRFL